PEKSGKILKNPKYYWNNICEGRIDVLTLRLRIGSRITKRIPMGPENPIFRINSRKSPKIN
ncbi:hypothetical protein, partial [Alteromonas stellipolaris]|uniref:hypothetical protein n=1 Tax=Alteromonas stellipolaris TaxID=233316 RepID=UPI001D6D476B